MSTLESDEAQTFAGYCPACESQTTFVVTSPNIYRSTRCQCCQCGPRQRALFSTLNRFFPTWRTMKIHESSPGWDKVSQRLVAECENYTASQWEQGLSLGKLVKNVKLPCKEYYVENLEAQTFDDN